MSNANRPHKKSNTTATTAGQGRAARQKRTPSQRGLVEGSARIARRIGWSGWVIPIAVGVVAGSLIAWWMWSSRTGSSEVEAAQPIATIEASDYHSLLVDPQDAQHVLFGSHEGTQESRDGGFTWQPGSLRGVDAMIMAASPNAPEMIYAAGHDVFQVSRDGGASWQPVTHDLPGTDIHGFAQNPTDPQRLYAFVVGAGGLTSADGGSTWEPFASQPPGGSYVVLASNGTDLYAATDAGIAKSRDHGATWESLATQPGKVTVLSLSVSASNPQTIYIGTPVGIIRSTDGGEKWTSIGPSSVSALALAVTPGDPGRVLLLSDMGAVYLSDDGGTTWQTPR